MRDQAGRRGPQLPQAWLAELDDCRRAVQELTTRIRQLTQQIRKLDEAGVPLEPGEFTYTVIASRVRSFSQANLRLVVGAAEVERLKDQIEPVIRYQVKVKPQEKAERGIES